MPVGSPSNIESRNDDRMGTVAVQVRFGKPTSTIPVRPATLDTLSNVGGSDVAVPSSRCETWFEWCMYATERAADHLWPAIRKKSGVDVYASPGVHI